jgi:RsiW-degrading membrane proteinase PrsW (M82 family)
MAKPRDQLFSVTEEIAVHPELPHEAASPEEPPPSASPTDAMARGYYGSVAFEPGQEALPRPPALPIRRRPLLQLLLETALAGVAGAVFAVPTLLLKGRESGLWVWMLCVFGPFAEETLKPSGMVFLLEKRPHSVQRSWQFPLAALLGGATFAVLENLLYRYVYLAKLPPEQLAAVMDYRWAACTALHICCTLLSSLGLRRIWRQSLKENAPCQLNGAFPWFVAATVVHGTYNLAMMTLQNSLFPKN